MFGMGSLEIFLILAVALIVLGPKKLPDLARSLGKALGEFRRATTDLKRSIDLDDNLSEVKQAFEDVNEGIRDAASTATEDITKETPQPASAVDGEVPADTDDATHATDSESATHTKETPAPDASGESAKNE